MVYVKFIASQMWDVFKTRYFRLVILATELISTYNKQQTAVPTLSTYRLLKKH